MSSDNEEDCNKQDVVTYFTQTTKMHGLASVTRNDQRSLFRRTFWFLISLGGMTAMCWYIRAILITFLNHDINTKINVEHKQSMNFPAVTLCNINPIRMSALEYGLTTDVGQNNLLQNIFDAVTEMRKISGRPPGPRGKGGPHPHGKTRPAKRGKRSMDSYQPPWHVDIEKWMAELERVKHELESRKKKSSDKNVANERSARPGWQQKPVASATQPPHPPPPPPRPPTGPPYLSDLSQQKFWTSANASDMTRLPDLLYRWFLEAIATSYELNSTLVTSMSNSLTNMLVDCSFNGMICNLSDFSHFWNYKYGSCYTFNAGWSSAQMKKVKRVGRPGALSGLSMTLYMNTPSFIHEFINKYSFKIVVHDRMKMPFPDDLGIDVPPQFQTTIGLRQTKVIRLPDPYPDACVDPAHKVGRDLYHTTEHPVAYSMVACMKTCIQNASIEQCGCARVEYPFTQALFDVWCNLDQNCQWDLTNKTEEWNVCDSMNDTQYTCYKQTEELYENNWIMCDCPNPCNSNVYQTSVSESVWPTPQSGNTIVKRMVMQSDELQAIFSPLSDPSVIQFYHQEIQKDLAKVDVFLEVLSFAVIEQFAAYLPEDVVSNLGGQAGLWVGLSMIAIFEVLEVFVNLKNYCTGGTKGDTVAPIPMKGIPE